MEVNIKQKQSLYFNYSFTSIVYTTFNNRLHIRNLPIMTKVVKRRQRKQKQLILVPLKTCLKVFINDWRKLYEILAATSFGQYRTIAFSGTIMHTPLRNYFFLFQKTHNCYIFIHGVMMSVVLTKSQNNQIALF